MNTNAALKVIVPDQVRLEKAKYLAMLTEDFKHFLMDDVMDGVADCFDDHLEFMKYALGRFIELSTAKQDE
jgi:hypothetical protein